MYVNIGLDIRLYVRRWRLLSQQAPYRHTRPLMYLCSPSCPNTPSYVPPRPYTPPYVPICPFMLPYALLCTNMPLMSPYAPHAPICPICPHMFQHAFLCPPMSSYVPTCLLTPPYALLCFHMPPYALIRPPMLSHASSCPHMPPYVSAHAFYSSALLCIHTPLEIPPESAVVAIKNPNYGMSTSAAYHRQLDASHVPVIIRQQSPKSQHYANYHHTIPLSLVFYRFLSYLNNTDTYITA